MLSLCIRKFILFFIKSMSLQGVNWQRVHFLALSSLFLFLLLYCVSIEVYNSPINRQENMSPVPVSLHSKMRFLVSTNSFHFPKLIIKNNYKDLCKLCVLSPANTNKMYHYLGFFLNPSSTMQYDPLLSALPSNILGTEVTNWTQYTASHSKHSQSFLNISNGIRNSQTIGLRNGF